MMLLSLCCGSADQRICAPRHASEHDSDIAPQRLAGRSAQPIPIFIPTIWPITTPTHLTALSAGWNRLVYRVGVRFRAPYILRVYGHHLNLAPQGFSDGTTFHRPIHAIIA